MTKYYYTLPSMTKAKKKKKDLIFSPNLKLFHH